MRYKLNAKHWDWWEGSDDPEDYVVEGRSLGRIAASLGISREELLSDAEVLPRPGEILHQVDTLQIVDGRYIYQYAVSFIDATHIYMKRYQGPQVPLQENVETGTVYHVAQLKEMAWGLYVAVWEWLHGKRSLGNMAFIA